MVANVSRTISLAGGAIPPIGGIVTSIRRSFALRAVCAGIDVND